MLKPKLNLSCWAASFISSRTLDEGKAAPPWLRAHFHRCAACHERYEEERHLAQQLAASAASMRRQSPPFLQARILANLQSRSPQLHSPRTRFAHAWALAGFGLSVVAVLFVVFTIIPSTKENSASSHAISAAVSPDVPVLSTSEDFLALSTKLDEPLEAELHLVINDARTALTSLSQSLFPEDFLNGLR
jgi:hypothetical protein